MNKLNSNRLYKDKIKVEVIANRENYPEVVLGEIGFVNQKNKSGSIANSDYVTVHWSASKKNWNYIFVKDLKILEDES